MSRPHLELTAVQMAFDTPSGPFIALDNLNLKIAKGEFVSLIGHSGCGKSTVLNIVAGLLRATQGGCVLDGHEVREPGPERAVVFQNHSLMPWLTVYENVELAVHQVFRRRMSRRKRREWILHNLALVHMEHARDKRPGEISGGMAQRVGIARALAMKPSVLLMDEPFGALDALTREEMSIELLRIWEQTRKTILFVTHSISEAVLLADRVVVMSARPGRVVKIVPIDLPRPRSADMEFEAAFREYHEEIRRLIFAN